MSAPEYQRNLDTETTAARTGNASGKHATPDYLALVKGVLDPLIPGGSKVALFDFPNHPNVGDNAIWLGEEVYLRTRRDLGVSVVDDCEIRHRTLPTLSASTVVLIHGGGNLGDLWLHHQELRERIVSHYRSHRIIQLPQSIHFEHSRNHTQCQRVLSSHRDFHLLVRDSASLELGQWLHDGATTLCPDMALCLGRLPRITEPLHSVLALLRTDKEGVTRDAPWQPMKDTMVVDWLSEASSVTQRLARRVDRLQAHYPRRLTALYSIKRRLYDRLARERLIRGSRLLESGKVVITNRLHAHILCSLMEIPHVVLDNNYGKISNFRNTWHTGQGLCTSAENLVQAQVKAKHLLDGLLAVRSA